MSSLYGSIQEYQWSLDQIRFSVFTAEKVDLKKISSINAISNNAEENTSKKGDTSVYSQQGKLEGIALVEKMDFEISCQNSKLDCVFSVDEYVDQSYSSESIKIISESLLNKIDYFIREFSKVNKVTRVAFSVKIFPDIEYLTLKDTIFVAEKILPFVDFRDGFEACDLKFVKNCPISFGSLKMFHKAFSVSSVTFVRIKKDIDFSSLDFEKLKQNTCLFNIDLNTDKKNDTEILSVIDLYKHFIGVASGMILNGVES